MAAAAGPYCYPGADLRYTAVFEVLPDIAVRPVEQFAIERPSAAVTEADIDAMIESMRRQRPVFTCRSSARRATTDRVTMDFEGRIDGQPFEGGEGERCDLHRRRRTRS